ncbi:DNA-binding protein [Parapedobacter koreensis]|uniref:HTH cro/C1-type domain-containing protein n=1 Tax=Parapedobacter koreensis TaxID=332977 RepID=A0A1H7UGP2_9SPHI|nr:DNA-binding protein [Parapedobacter koreensis]SEL95904.1 hypothetical protein SAMN05421740_11551 [Parapedobacter koreensis]
MAFGDRLAFARKQKKMTQGDLGVTLDYLVKDGEYEHIDNETLKRLKEVQGLDSDTRAHVFATIDAFIKAAKLKSIAAL